MGPCLTWRAYSVSVLVLFRRPLHAIFIHVIVLLSTTTTTILVSSTTTTYVLFVINLVSSTWSFCRLSLYFELVY